MKKIYFLLPLFFSFFACGQNRTEQPKQNAEKSTSPPIGQPKIIKTQGSTQYDNIHCRLMDKDGNLWFGTTGEGVYHYDGKLFTHFTVEDGLSNNTVWAIAEDKAGNIWFGTNDGLCRYDGKIITSIPISTIQANDIYLNNSSNSDPSKKNTVWSIMQDKTGKMWFGTSDGVYYYNGIFFTHFLDKDKVINDSNVHLRDVQCMLQDKNGDIWFGSGPMAFEGLCRYDGKAITKFKPHGEIWIRYMLEDKNGIIWLGTRHQGIWRYDGKTFAKFKDGKDIGIASRDIGLAALIDKEGNIWFSGGENDNGFGGDGGVWRYDGKSFTNFTTKDGLGDYSVWSILEDRAGNIWVGTRNTGLYRYDGKKFVSFTEGVE